MRGWSEQQLYAEKTRRALYKMYQNLPGNEAQLTTIAAATVLTCIALSMWIEEGSLGRHGEVMGSASAEW
jgi:hypothetical protein